MIKKLIKKFIPQILLDRYHYFLALLGALIYRFPSKKIKVIGVTGTSGKTTVAEMIAKILEEAKYKVALINSIRFKIGKDEKINTLRMTMPGRFFIQRFLREAVNSSCQYCILEVTSEGIKQHRHKFIDFDVAVFTNLSPEHIEAHGSFENYREDKGKFFLATKKNHILNLDDKNFEYFFQFPAEKKYLFTTSREKFNAFKKRSIVIFSENIKISPSSSKFSLNNIPFNLNLLGKFNISNALAAICVGISQGIDLNTCKKALENFKGVAGRMEKVIEKPFRVIVDYAITPDALEKVYQSINSKLKTQNSRIICLFGACGGGRDKWKRPVLGKIADKFCDFIILTNEDPYDEDPEKIIEQIEKGIENKKLNEEYFKILDRKKAISKALGLAKKDDVVIITGKGCEPSICLANGKKIPWDDREIVKQEFKNLRLYEKI